MSATQQSTGPAVISPQFRIGLLCADLGRMNVTALKYLVLQMNTRLSRFNFEFLPDSAIHFPKMAHGQLVDWDAEKANLVESVKQFVIATNKAQSDYGISSSIPTDWILITRARFTDEYYLHRSRPLAVFALGNWARWMAPPSVLEFIITLLLIDGLNRISPTFSKTRSHYGTRGCIGDFSVELSDARFKTLTGFVCPDCSNALKADGLSDVLTEIRPILTREWLGSGTDPASVTSTVSKLGFNLFTTRSIAEFNFWRRLRPIFEDKAVDHIVKLVFAIAIAILALRIPGLRKVGD